MATLAVDNIYNLQKIATHAYRASHGAAPIGTQAVVLQDPLHCSCKVCCCCCRGDAFAAFISFHVFSRLNCEAAVRSSTRMQPLRVRLQIDCTHMCEPDCLS